MLPHFLSLPFQRSDMVDVLLKHWIPPYLPRLKSSLARYLHGLIASMAYQQ